MSGLDSSIVKNKCQLYGLVTLRVLIGWCFLYEEYPRSLILIGLQLFIFWILKDRSQD